MGNRANWALEKSSAGARHVSSSDCNFPGKVLAI